MSEERALDWPGVREQMAQRGVMLPDDALPFWFGNTPELARELGTLVRGGTKRATAGLVASWQTQAGGLPHAGQVFVVLDWAGQALAVIQNRSVEVLPFEEVGADFAAAEGEGDGSLEWWRDAHWRYFSEECARMGIELDRRTPVVCIRFGLLWPGGL